MAEEGRLRFYGTGLRPGPQCWSLGLLAPAEAPMRYRIEIEQGQTLTGTVPAGQLRTQVIVVPRLAERGTGNVTLTGEGVRLAGINPGC